METIEQLRMLPRWRLTEIVCQCVKDDDLVHIWNMDKDALIDYCINTNLGEKLNLDAIIDFCGSQHNLWTPIPSIAS